jgi:hypothetical protein
MKLTNELKNRLHTRGKTLCCRLTGGGAIGDFAGNIAVCGTAIWRTTLSDAVRLELCRYYVSPKSSKHTS